MEASTLTHAQTQRARLVRGLSPTLRLQKDDRLIALIRSGNSAAFELLFDRYQARLLAFCRHMLKSQEDAEDVLQEVFVAAHRAIMADSRPINTRPWLYRIARNRCLNHLRKPVPDGQDSMDILPHEHGTTTADRVHQREEFRQLITDVTHLPETQRTALLLREVDALSYEDIAHAMDTTVPSVKSLLVRARMALAESSQARQLTCDEVRVQLAEASEGMAKLDSIARRHVRGCDGCQDFRKQLRADHRALVAILPIGPLLLLKKFAIAKFGWGAAAGAAGGSGAAGGAAATGAASTAALGAGSAATATGVTATAASVSTATGLSAAGGVVGGAVATKAAAGVATAALLTAGAVEVQHTVSHPSQPVAKSAPAVPGEAPATANAVAATPEDGTLTQERAEASATTTTPADPAHKAGEAVDPKASAVPATTAPVVPTATVPAEPKQPPAGTTTQPARATAPAATPAAPQPAPGDPRADEPAIAAPPAGDPGSDSLSRPGGNGPKK